MLAESKYRGRYILCKIPSWQWFNPDHPKLKNSDWILAEMLISASLVTIIDLVAAYFLKKKNVTNENLGTIQCSQKLLISNGACLVLFFTEYKREAKPDLVVSIFYPELNITQSGISTFIPGTMVSPIARNPSNRRLCAPFGVIGTPSNYSDRACLVFLFTEYKRRNQPS